MEAASAGAGEAGGTVIGILPGNSAAEGNPYLTFAVATGLSEARNAIIARTANAVIAVGGEFGTLSEIGLALKMGKPVIGLQTWSICPPGSLKGGITEASSPEEAVDRAFELAGKTIRG